MRDYAEVLKFPATTRPNIHIRSMTYSEADCNVFVTLDNGRLVLCGSNVPSDPSQLTVNYTPVKTECPGNGKPIYTVAVLTKHNRLVIIGN